jgi:hypothetical protein
MEVKNETNKVTSDNHAQAEDVDFSFITQDFEDFKVEWMKVFYPEWAHPSLKRK